MLELLTEEQENVLEKNMIWIFGSPRSGTTWLRKLMSANPKNLIWNEPYLGVHFRIHKNQLSRKDYVFSQYYKDDWLPSLRKFILSCTYSHVRTIQNKIIIKEPNGSGAAPLLLECLPNSKFIFLLRDGRDVVDSLIDAHKANSWNPEFSAIPLSNQKIREKQIEYYSKVWNNLSHTIWEAYKKHQPNLRLLIKYEELMKNTSLELKKIYEFLDDTIENIELEKIISKHDFGKIPLSEKGSGKFYRSANPGSWKKNFSDKEQQLMNSIMGDTLSQFNY